MCVQYASVFTVFVCLHAHKCTQGYEVRKVERVQTQTVNGFIQTETVRTDPCGRETYEI